MLCGILEGVALGKAANVQLPRLGRCPAPVRLDEPQVGRSRGGVVAVQADDAAQEQAKPHRRVGGVVWNHAATETVAGAGASFPRTSTAIRSAGSKSMSIPSATDCLRQ